MKILRQEIVDLEQVADLCAIGMERKPPTPRDSSKWHVTSLIASSHRIVKGSISYTDDNVVPPNIRALGYLGRIWETAVDCYLSRYAVLHKGVYVPDMEQEDDGILGSLDGIMILPELGLVMCETKLRFTIKEEIPLDHVQQIRAYCHLADTDLVCYVSGHVSTAPPAAHALLRVIRLTKQSIEETWGMLVNTKKYLEDQGITPTG